jgi:hypothetical protein
MLLDIRCDSTLALEAIFNVAELRSHDRRYAIYLYGSGKRDRLSWAR